MDDLISRQLAIDTLKNLTANGTNRGMISGEDAVHRIEMLPPAQPETATVTIGRTKGSVTMWYECDACGEPVDQKDNYCRNCGRKLKHE